MYGLIGEIEAVAGKGAELAETLANVAPMPGCLNYIVAKDIEDPDVIWRSLPAGCRSRSSTGTQAGAVHRRSTGGRAVS